jgi:hypothetical protein
MTQYIENDVFRSCITKDIANYPYFNKNEDNTVTLKPLVTNSIKKSNPLNFLMINDTFHDLVNPRGTYNPKGFIEGPLNYLLTGDKSITGDNVKIYENGINFPEFQQLTGRFEPKVAKSFEINMGLQTADTFITYDDILRDVRVPSPNQITINGELLDKVIKSNGSIAISLNSGENSTFSAYIEQQNMDDAARNQEYLKISYFIRWYLHCPNLPQQGRPDRTFQIAESTMKILFDAGSSFLKEFFSAERSMVQPFVAIPCILDSASTSTEKLDPTLDFHFERLEANQVVPIVSNYFSCDKYFFCYLPNTADEYSLDTLYGFSLAIFKIDQPNHNEVDPIGRINNIQIAITKVREIYPHDDAAAAEEDYINAVKYIFNYINANPNIVARYYFGQVKKDKGDSSSCGTCGAGVPYIGRVISKIKELLVPPTAVNLPIDQVPFQPANENNGNAELRKILSNLNPKDTDEPLGGRIPFSDTRIAKIFCTANGNITVSNDDLYSLFQILADYKRTGDYQQAYTLLKAILTGAKDNSEFFTFCSGDELSALIGRLLGVPTIYQTASGAQCRLYRGRSFTGSREDKLKYKLSNDINIIQKYCNSIRGKIENLQIFITHNYKYNLQLREKLRTFITDLEGEFTNPPVINDKQMNTFFKLISVRNAFNKLEKIIELSDHLLDNFFELPASAVSLADDAVAAVSQSVSQAANVGVIFDLCKQIKTIKEGPDNLLLENEVKINETLIKVSQFEENINGLKIFNFIEDNFPQYFNNIKIQNNVKNNQILIDYDDKDNLAPLNTIRNLKIPLLGVNFFSSKVKSVSSLYSTYNSAQPSEQLGRVSQRNASVMRDKKKLQKTEFLNGYNEFIDSCKFLVGEFKIQSYDEFTGIMSSVTIAALTDFSAPGAVVPGAVVPAVVPGAVVQSPTPDEQKVAIIMLNLSRALKEISQTSDAAAEEQEHVGGNNKPTYNQQGGATPHENIRTILNDVKQLLLNLYNKCTNYIKNVQNDAEIKPISSDLTDVGKFQRFLNAISGIYETDEFCYQLLFQEADVEEENTIDNINIGFLTGLKLITDQYTYSDLGYSQSNIFEKNISINYLLHSQNDKLNLYPIKILLYILGWSNYEPISDAAAATAAATAATDSTFLLELIDTYFVDPDAAEVLLLLPQGPSLPGVKPIQPVEFVSSNKSELVINKDTIDENIKSIFSILTISIMEYLYYGNYGNIYSFNEDFLGGIWRTITQTGSIRNSFDEPTNIYLQSTFLTYLNSTLTYVQIKMGISSSSASGVRSERLKQNLSKTKDMTIPSSDRRRKVNGGKQRKTIKKNKTRTNSKTRKMRKIRKHKFTKRMKKSNRLNKRSRK